MSASQKKAKPSSIPPEVQDELNHILKEIDKIDGMAQWTSVWDEPLHARGRRRKCLEAVELVLLDFQEAVEYACMEARGGIEEAASVYGPVQDAPR